MEFKNLHQTTSEKSNLPHNIVVAVVGPTGSGKTELGVKLAQHFQGVIISADSRQVYQGLDCGTNKEGQPGQWEDEPARMILDVPQLLVDVVRPGERFTLHDWLLAARRLRTKISQKNCLPLVVGGTGLYVSALVDGYQPGGGRFVKERQKPTFRSLILMPKVDRDELYRRSDKRFERIFDDLVHETEGLLQLGVSHDWLQSIGLDYRFASYFLTRKMNREIAINQFQQASRQYIRRQLTWWRHHNVPVLVSSPEEAIRRVEEFASGKEFDTV